MIYVLQFFCILKLQLVTIFGFAHQIFTVDNPFLLRDTIAPAVLSIFVLGELNSSARGALPLLHAVIQLNAVPIDDATRASCAYSLCP